MTTIKRRGYVLFEYLGGINFCDYCNSKQELKNRHNSHLDDKWDVDGRTKYHYFYLDISLGKFFPLERWKNNYAPLLGFNQCKKTVLSKTF